MWCTVEALAKETCIVDTVVLTHLNPDIVQTLAAAINTMKRPTDGKVSLVLSNPALQVCCEVVSPFKPIYL